MSQKAIDLKAKAEAEICQSKPAPHRALNKAQARKADAEAIRKHYGKTTTEEQLAKAKAQRSAPNKAQHSSAQEWLYSEAYKHDASTVAIVADLKAHADKLAEALRVIQDSLKRLDTLKGLQQLAIEALAAYEEAK